MNGLGVRWILGVTPAEGDRPDGGGLEPAEVPPPPQAARDRDIAAARVKLISFFVVFI